MTPYRPEKNTAAAITQMLSGKPVSCAAMYFSIALSRLDTEIDVTLNTSASTMMRVSSAVSWAVSASKPLYTRLTSGWASTSISADTTSDASANRLIALLAK